MNEGSLEFGNQALTRTLYRRQLDTAIEAWRFSWNVGQLASHDLIWDTIRHSAASLAAEEPILGSLAHASMLNQSCFEYALSYIVARRLGSEDVSAMLLREVYEAITVDDAEIRVRKLDRQKRTVLAQFQRAVKSAPRGCRARCPVHCQAPSIASLDEGE